MNSIIKPHPPELVAAVRSDFETTQKPVPQIARDWKVADTTVYRWIAAGGWVRPGAVRPKPARTSGGAVRSPRPRSLRRRIMAAIEQDLTAVERVLEQLKGAGAASEAERSARALASLARTVAELTRSQEKPSTKEKTQNDDFPRCTEELRRELSEKLAHLVAGQPDKIPDGD